MRTSAIAYSVAHFGKCRLMSANEDPRPLEDTMAAYLEGIGLASAFLGMDGEMPFGTIYLCPSRAEYDLFVAHLTPTPTSKGRVGQPQGAELYLLSPTAYHADAAPFFLGPDGQYDKAKYRRLVVHECVHMVEEAVRPRGAMDAIPLYWSEGLAVYLSEQFNEEDIQEHMASDLASNAFLTLDSLAGARAYTWGWTVVRFMADAYGPESIAQFSKEDGELSLHAFVGLQKHEFEAKWLQSISHSRASAQSP